MLYVMSERVKIRSRIFFAAIIFTYNTMEVLLFRLSLNELNRYFNIPSATTDNNGIVTADSKVVIANISDA